MNEVRDLQERYYKRVMERHFWAKLGLPLFIFGFACIVLSVGTIFFNGSFTIVRLVSSIGFGGITIGGFSMILFGRLGWSKSKLVDLLLNRLSVILIIASQFLVVIHLGLGYTSKTIQEDSIVTIVGVILALLGIFFHSRPLDDPRIKG
jgi:hypothetical protein